MIILTMELLPEYCAMEAQYLLFANADNGLAKRRRIGQITRRVICPMQVVNPLSPRIRGVMTALRANFARSTRKIRILKRDASLFRQKADLLMA